MGEGRQKQDKRAAIADRDWKRDKARLMRAAGNRRHIGEIGEGKPRACRFGIAAGARRGGGGRMGIATPPLRVVAPG